MAALDLIVEAAARKPVLVLADDVHRIDPSSQRALAFVGRRISSDRVILLATHRDEEEGSLADPTLASIDLAPLDRASAAEILDRAANVLDTRTRTLILEVASGNPLALLELPRTLTAADDATNTDRLPLTRRLELSFAARIGDLDPTTRAALNLAALNDYNVAEIIAATELLVGTATPAVLDPAIAAGLISVEGTAVRFEHPLIRSSIYQRLSPAAQRAGHNALARVLHDSPERALWHWAAAALHPDSALAAALEQSADRALQRGATSNAVYVLERSAQLSVKSRTSAGVYSAPPLWDIRPAAPRRPTGCARVIARSSVMMTLASCATSGCASWPHRSRRRAARQCASRTGGKGPCGR